MNAAPNALDDPKAFKFFALQEKKAMSLLREVLWRWRRSSAYVRGTGGKWAAYPLETWRNWMGGLPRRTLDRCLKTLHDNGLIDRERHRFAGNKVCTFLRPTELALKYVGKEGDLDTLTGSKTAKKKPELGALLVATVGVPLGAIGGATDHTSVSFHSTPPYIQKKTPAHTSTGGKGKAGEEVAVKKKLKLQSLPKVNDAPPPLTGTDQDDLEALLTASKAKRLAKLLTLFPVLQGAHQKYVWHPYERHGDKWAGWSKELQKKRHAEYEKMVHNWYQGKKGKAYKPLSYDDAEFSLDLDSLPDFEEALFKK